MGKSKLYKEIKNELDNIETELIENNQKQLKLLEPEYKKINLNGPMNETEFSIFIRYKYYKSQEERITGGEEYQERLEKQCTEFLVTVIRYHVKYHKVIGDDNPEYREKYEKYKKTFEEFLLANNDDGKLFDYLALNEQDFKAVINDTVEYTVDYVFEHIDKENSESNKETINDIKKLLSKNEIPKYNKTLIEIGYLAPDGKTAFASLDAIAEFLKTLKLDNFNYKLLMQYRQHDGQPFSINSAKEAVKRSSRI